MFILNVDLNNINLDDTNHKENDPDVHVKILPRKFRILNPKNF